MESATIMKILLLNMLLAFAVHADTTAPPASDESPPQLPGTEVPQPPMTVLPPPAAPLLPQPPPLPQFPPPQVDDPIAPPPMSCKDQCSLKCAEKGGLRKLFCMGKCLGMCKIFSPSDHAGYQCTRDCVMNNLHHQQDIKSIDGLVNTCYSNCSKNV